MEHKSKSLATGTCEGERPCTVDMIDRISNLPNEVVHRIFSKLHIEDVARFCCVSKRWRKLCLSAPSVNFDFSDLPDECELKLKLMNALDRFLLSRGDTEMKKFSISWLGHDDDEVDDGCFCINESFRIITWIQNAVRCKVEKVYLWVTFFDYEGEPLEFPSFVFCSSSLRYLTVDMPRTVVKTPSFNYFSNIEILRLTEVAIEDRFFKWISCCCRSLNNMSLHSIHQIRSIAIECSSLEKFYFGDLEVDQTVHINISGEKLKDIKVYCGDWPAIVKFVAPNVKHLSFMGKVKNQVNLGELECLKQALILMEPVEGEFDKVFEVVLSEATIKAAYREEHTEAQLEKIWYLQMNIGSFTDGLVPAVVCLLRRTPELCALYC